MSRIDMEIWEQVKRNLELRDSCTGHEFSRQKSELFSKYVCCNCGCTEDISYVKGYEQGIAHGRGGKDE